MDKENWLEVEQIEQNLRECGGGTEEEKKDRKTEEE